MPEAALPLFPIDTGGTEAPAGDLSSDSVVAELADVFCRTLPHRDLPYRRRNWGGLLHSLCSYQGKLKPAIAHFLVSWFTADTDVVLDPMSGVGTIPLEARLQGRRGLAGDLSELATIVSRAKLEAFSPDDVDDVFNALSQCLEEDETATSELAREEAADFGLNGPVADYFEEQTLREVLLARRFFKPALADPTPAEAVVLTALLHILHGNRPYALSRRSHPVTPFKPTGPAEYRPLLGRLRTRLSRTVDPLHAIDADGQAYRSDYQELPIGHESVDAVITSPPFAQSLRFFSTNWLRLWFCGWGPDDFDARPEGFLERQQRQDFDGAYKTFLVAMQRVLRPGGLLILHLGETKRLDMAARIKPLLEPAFGEIYVGRECVADTESHGLTDKGATRAHGFIFARAR